MLSLFTVFLSVSFFFASLRVGSLNVNGARGQGKQAFIADMIKDKQISVCFLQKTHTDGRNEADGTVEGC